MTAKVENDMRGRMTIDLGGKPRRMLITLDAIRRIEQRTRTGWMSVCQRAFESNSTLTDMAAILEAATDNDLNDAGHKISYDEAEHMIMDEGMITVMSTVKSLLITQMVGLDRAPKATEGGEGVVTLRPGKESTGTG